MKVESVAIIKNANAEQVIKTDTRLILKRSIVLNISSINTDLLIEGYCDYNLRNNTTNYAGLIQSTLLGEFMDLVPTASIGTSIPLNVINFNPLQIVVDMDKVKSNIKRSKKMKNHEKQKLLDKEKWLESEAKKSDQSGNMYYCRDCDFRIKYDNKCLCDEYIRESESICATAYNRYIRNNAKVRNNNDKSK